jgi:hypothetical protein
MRSIIAALMLCATVTIARAFDAPTGEEIAACTPDAMKLCWREIWGRGAHSRVFNCLRDHRADLSADCKAVFKARGL